jgi:hypothetical protein
MAIPANDAVKARTLPAFTRVLYMKSTRAPILRLTKLVQVVVIES